MSIGPYIVGAHDLAHTEWLVEGPGIAPLHFAGANACTYAAAVHAALCAAHLEGYKSGQRALSTIYAQSEKTQGVLK